jgi:hypothetical protein
MAATQILEEIELTVSLTVVGCQFREWDQDAFLDDPSVQFKVSLKEDPDNPYQPDGKAMQCVYAAQVIGMVGKEHLDDVAAFRRAYKLVQPYLKEYDSIADISNIVCDPSGKIKYFDVVFSVVAHVPSGVADAIDAV